MIHSSIEDTKVLKKRIKIINFKNLPLIINSVQADIPPYSNFLDMKINLDFMFVLFHNLTKNFKYLYI